MKQRSEVRGRRSETAVVLLVLVAVMAASQGCGVLRGLRPESPEQEWALAARSFALVQHSAVDLHTAGAISDEQFLTVEAYAVHVRRALDEWEKLIKWGLDPEKAREDFQTSLDRMEARVEELKAEGYEKD